MSRAISFPVTRTVAAPVEVRQVAPVAPSRTVVVTDDVRTVTVERRNGVAITRETRIVSPVQPSRTITVIQGSRGATGPAGTGTDQILGTFTLAETVASSSLVHISDDGLAYKADSSQNRRADGFTIAGGSSGGSLEVTRLGTITGLTGRTTGKVQWLSTNGLMTETVPTGGMLQEIGIAKDSDNVFFDPADAVVLA